MILFDWSGHKQLWEWLARNPCKMKEDWSLWKRNADPRRRNAYEKVFNDCFACEYDLEVSNLLKRGAACDYCPFFNYAGRSFSCLNGLYENYTDWQNELESRKKYRYKIIDRKLAEDYIKYAAEKVKDAAMAIRNLPLREDIEVLWK